MKALPFLIIFLLLQASSALSAMDSSIIPAPNADWNWGYVDASTGKVLIKPQFSRAGFFYDGFAIVSRSYPEEAFPAKTPAGEQIRIVPRGEGIINRKGEEILAPRFTVSRANTDMHSTWRGTYIPRLFLVKGGEGDSMVLHVDKGAIVPPGFHQRIEFEDDGSVFCDGVYYSPEGAKLTPPQDCVVAYKEKDSNTFRVRNKKEDMDRLEGVIRADGSVLVPVEYHDITAMPQAGVWLASRTDELLKTIAMIAVLTGRTGDADIPASKDILTVDVYGTEGTKLRSFRARWTPYATGENYSYTGKGVVHYVHARSGKTVPAQTAQTQTGNYRIFQEDKLFGIKNASDAVTVPPQYEVLRHLGGDLFTASLRKGHYQDTYGLMDGDGRIILPFTYGGIVPASFPSKTDGPLVAMKWQHGSAKAYWLMDRQGRFITPESAPYQSDFHFNAAGLAKVRKNNKLGLMDHTGRQVLPCEFSSVFDDTSRQDDDKKRAQNDAPPASRPDQHVYRVERDNLWGIYDGTGKEIVPCLYGFIHTVKEDWVHVENPDRTKSGLVNICTGQLIAPLYSSVQALPGAFEAYMDRSLTPDGRATYVLLDAKGRETGRYEHAEWFENAQVLAVRREKQFALVDGKGEALTPFRYESVWKADGGFIWGYYATTQEYGDKKGRSYTPYLAYRKLKEGELPLWGEQDTNKVLVDKKGKEYRIFSDKK